MTNLRLLILASIGLIFLFSCREPVYTPKPRGYYAIDLPEKKYKPFDTEGYPYKFETPVYSSIQKDSLYFNEKVENPWWINIDFPQLGGTIHMSYKAISASSTLQQMLQDSYELSHYHTKKADYINEPVFHTPNNVHGVFYHVGGNAASAFQFFATDSHKHFIRGALYFDVTPNADSLKPVNKFLIKDIEHIINTLSWTR